MSISVNEIRKDFPLLENQKVIYLDTAATSQKPVPAEPIVCTRLLSKMEFFRMITRITPMEITAAGMDAETVIPTRNPPVRPAEQVSVGLLILCIYDNQSRYPNTSAACLK